MISPDRVAELQALVAEHLIANPPPVLGPVQLTQADLARMPPAAVVAAQASGGLDTLLGITRRVASHTADWQVTSAELAKMTPAEITDARKRGRLADLLASRPVHFRAPAA